MTDDILQFWADRSDAQWPPIRTQFDDLECRELLHGGGSRYRDGFGALNLGLQAAARDVAKAACRWAFWRETQAFRATMGI
jgi:hypothetical protein